MYRKIKFFISSVQSEFALERAELVEYISSDSLMGRYFEPFIFEQLPASDTRTDKAYLTQVGLCDIYLRLLGQKYGSVNENGISPTELEYSEASRLYTTRLVYLKNVDSEIIEAKQVQFINKVQSDLIRRKFNEISDLKTQVYKSLITYLTNKEIILTKPFDASHAGLGLSEIDNNKIEWFIKIAQSKRGLPLRIGNDVKEFLIHLNLLEGDHLTKAAVLLFGKNPQKYFLQSEVRCAHFHGTIIEKPIPSYKVFKGNIFTLIDDAVDFVLSKLDYRIETRTKNTSIPGGYEIPRAVVAEAIVNAIAHRDYSSKGSVQVMLFKDRLEIWNPGHLPLGWGVSKLKEPHSSVPYNPLIAEVLYLSGYIERMGTGTADIYRLSALNELREPNFIQTDEFKIILYRPENEYDMEIETDNTDQLTDQLTDQPTDQPTGQVIPEEVLRIVLVMSQDSKRQELMDILELKQRVNFMDNYINPTLELRYIELTYPTTPNHPKQRYRLTEKGRKLRQQLMNNKKRKNR